MAPSATASELRYHPYKDDALRRQQPKQSPVPKKNWNCEPCKRPFPTQNALRRHLIDAPRHQNAASQRTLKEGSPRNPAQDIMDRPPRGQRQTKPTEQGTNVNQSTSSTQPKPPVKAERHRPKAQAANRVKTTPPTPPQALATTGLKSPGAIRYVEGVRINAYSANTPTA